MTAYRYILDAHPIIWYLEGNPRLGSRAKEILDDPDNRFVVPIIALAEATYVVEKGRSSISSVSDLTQSLLRDPRLEIYPLTWDILNLTLTATSIPELHDRLIVGTALFLQEQGHSVILVSKDETIVERDVVSTVW